MVGTGQSERTLVAKLPVLCYLWYCATRLKTLTDSVYSVNCHGDQINIKPVCNVVGSHIMRNVVSNLVIKSTSLLRPIPDTSRNTGNS